MWSTGETSQRSGRRETRGISRRLGGITMLLGIVILVGAVGGAPSAARTDDPIVVPGNPTCTVGDFSFKDDDGPPSPAANADVRISYPDDTHVTITWTPGFIIHAVIVKAGDGAVIYTSSPWESLPSVENNGGQLADISHVTVCYSAKRTTTSTKPSTTKPTKPTTTKPTTTKPTTTQPTRPTKPTTTTSTKPTTTSPSLAPTSTSTTKATTTTTKATTTTTTSSTTTSTTTTSTTQPTTTPTQLTPSTTAATTTTTTTTTTPTEPTTTTTEASTTTIGAPVVSVLPLVVAAAQTELPETGLGQGWAALLGAALVLAGSGMLVATDHRRRAGLRAPIDRA